MPCWSWKYGPFNLICNNTKYYFCWNNCDHWILVWLPKTTLLLLSVTFQNRRHWRIKHVRSCVTSSIGRQNISSPCNHLLFVVVIWSGIVDEDHNLINPHLYTKEFRHKLAAVDWSLQEIDEEYDMVEFTNRTGHQLDEMIVEVRFRTILSDLVFFTSTPSSRPIYLSKFSEEPIFHKLCYNCTRLILYFLGAKHFKPDE